MGLALFSLIAQHGVAAETPETPHLAFATEYIRELAAIENIRDGAKRELNESDATGKLMAGIHADTLFEIELQAEILTLKDMRLNAPYDDLIPGIIDFYSEKIKTFKRIDEILQNVVSALTGPKPGEDYGKLIAEMPKLRAKLMTSITPFSRPLHLWYS